ncbi:tetratricopeptide repeat protein [Paraburkholderia acidisoli]|uniref:protein O-GlcNAc transferase n=1 Tax=Paraburkholderia acidisoli TaxID=2571748 RepID=A0A7Z2JHS1_9BURK|nr:glycosyltransferase family 41 protein [Paraburkholderia acidisoli]QGZ64388.1 tetratricopeptide repeat protein [Paraburkholderia acidisoli]
MPDASLFDRASERHFAGDLPHARQLYLELLNTDAAHAAAMFRLAVIGLQEGAPDEATGWLERALAIEPGHRRYREALAQAHAMAGRHGAAATLYHALLAEDAASADLWFALATALQAQGRLSEAVEAWRAVVQREAQRADAWNNLGNCLRLLDHADASRDAYTRALEAQPGDANALTNLGTLLQAQGRDDEALAMLRAAHLAAPDSASALVNLGVLLTRMQQAHEAAPLLARAVAIEPHLAHAAYNYGVTLQALGRLDEAAAQYRQALSLDPAHAEAANNLGNALRDLGEHRAAQDAYETALRARPDFVDAYNNAANLMRTLGRLDDAHALLRRALDLDPARSATLNNLGNVLKDSGDLDEGIACFRRAVASEPGNVIAHGNLLYALSFQASDAGEILEEAQRWSARHEAPLRAGREPAVTPPAPTLAAGKRLRIGYVSADFREHCQALFMTPLLAHHDRTRFEIHAYSSVVRPDARTARLAEWVDVWHDVRTLDDAALAQRIRADGIDILVDLTMHMADGRPLLFARKPAPLQVAWLAYPGTTGIGAIDWRLTDPHLDPLAHDAHYTERTWRLPDTFWCYDPLAAQPEPNALPAESAGHVTFGSLNNPCKLTDTTFRLWARVFERLPTARLVLLAPEGDARRRIGQRMAHAGIDVTRVVFVPFRARDAYLRSYHEIDIGLDTLPYNGHTTSLDALWMGVPVVTRVGATVAGRAGLSQLANLGLSELAAASDESFVETAVALAQDLPRLAALRATLRARMEVSPLMDGARFARAVETAFSSMWSAAASRAERT